MHSNGNLVVLRGRNDNSFLLEKAQIRKWKIALSPIRNARGRHNTERGAISICNFSQKHQIWEKFNCLSFDFPNSKKRFCE